MRRIVPGATAVAALAAVWQLAALAAASPQLPGPLAVLAALGPALTSGRLAFHLGVSLLRLLAAAVLAFLPALALGIAAGASKRLDSWLTPPAYLLGPIPKTALLPAILLFLGLGDAPKVLLVALILYFPFYLGFRDEARAIDKSYYDALATLGGGRRAALVRIVLPCLLPRIWSGLRSGAGTGLAVLFLAETFATRSGAGWWIMDAWTRLAYPAMYAGILALALVGLALAALIDLGERLSCRWKGAD